MEQLFFVASKLVWALLSPIMMLNLLWVSGTIFLMIRLRKIALYLLLPATIFSLSLMILPVGDWLMFPLESRIQQPAELPPQIDGVIILGGGEDIATSFSWQQPQVGQAADRFFAAAHLAKHYPESTILFTGGNNALRFEAGKVPEQLGRKLLGEIGIDDHRIITESRSRNTDENFKYLKTLLPKRTGKYLLITSAYHMPRAIGVAEKQGVLVIPYPVDYRSQPEQFREFNVALFEQITKLEPAFREWVGLTVYFVTGKTSRWFPKHSFDSAGFTATDV